VNKLILKKLLFFQRYVLTYIK